MTLILNNDNNSPITFNTYDRRYITNDIHALSNIEFITINEQLLNDFLIFKSYIGVKITNIQIYTGNDLVLELDDLNAYLNDLSYSKSDGGFFRACAVINLYKDGYNINAPVVE